MGIIGSNWKDDPTPEEEYQEITGIPFYGTDDELIDEIESTLGSAFTSKTERSQLQDLQSRLQYNQEEE